MHLHPLDQLLVDLEHMSLHPVIFGCISLSQSDISNKHKQACFFLYHLHIFGYTNMWSIKCHQISAALQRAQFSLLSHGLQPHITWERHRNSLGRQSSSYDRKQPLHQSHVLNKWTNRNGNNNNPNPVELRHGEVPQGLPVYHFFWQTQVAYTCETIKLTRGNSKCQEFIADYVSLGHQWKLSASNLMRCFGIVLLRFPWESRACSLTYPIIP